jgi:hypothetical protein
VEVLGLTTSYWKIRYEALSSTFVSENSMGWIVRGRLVEPHPATAINPANEM